jgi:hypothetical protein
MRTHANRFISFLVLAIALLVMPAASYAQVSVGVSITVAPPEIPVYDQPVCPGDGYLWVPGYWAWGDDDYYWVPGTWVLAPEVGFLWTPGYWGWGGTSFIFHEGYWGPTIGFYGGVNYGFGYFGVGFVGGRWDGGHFFYNRAVANVNVTVIHNVYNENVVNRSNSRVSYNGGQGGLDARPTPQEEAAARERHIAPISAQVQHEQAARADTSLRASSNHGHPPIGGTSKPGELNDRGTAAGGAENRPEERTENMPAGGGNEANRSPAIHPKDLPPAERMATPNTGNPKLDQKYQQEQDKLSAKQDQERQKLQQKQDQEHQRYAQQKANDAKNQQLEQKHQQQTQQLEQRHTQQQQQLMQREPHAPAAAAPRAPAEERR